MKNKFKRTIGPAVLLLIATLSLTSCYEYRYQRQYSHHTRGWYDRRHAAYPAGVSWEVDVRGRR